ncbi:Alpha/Beta hydrolase protein [Collybia nuda]|uniref:Alpha/Beta hydrolase protein n=1 Tax=Collybia nuda TaxID=64659 RepID=A0A9P6CGV6_9AGAR|nr:Alpha/Beta hydrolase protein [Collybia nuda]
MKLHTIFFASVFSAVSIAVSSAALVGRPLSPATRTINALIPSKRAPSVCPTGVSATAEISQDEYDNLVYYYTYAYAAYSDKCITPNINRRDSQGYLVEQLQTSVKGHRVLRGVGNHFKSTILMPIRPIQFEDKPTDTQAFVAVDESRKEIIVAFRGSESWKDFWTDAKILLLPMIVQYNATHNLNVPKDVRVHRGFLNVYNTISNELAIFVRDELKRNPEYSIVTTGHSLGGALASLSGVIFRTLMKA